MIDSVPLIQNANDAQQINASIIAMKKASRELDEKIVKLNSLNSELDKKIALLDSGLNKEIEDRKEAINSLDVSSVGGSGKYISAISETDGKISATASDITSSVSSGNSQPVTSGAVFNALENKVNSQYFTIDTTKSYVKINCPYNFCYIVVFFGTTVADNSTEIAQGYGDAGVRYSINKISGTRNSARLQGGSENNRYLYGTIDGQVSALKIIPLLGSMPTVEYVNAL
jgi:hypothetical protein